MAAGSVLNNQNPKETYTKLLQQTLNKEFYNSTDWYTVEEETVLRSETYQNVDVRINNVVAPTTGDNVEDDYKKILFKELNHSVDLGRLYRFDSNFWLTINVDKIKTLFQTVVVKRCNNVLRWLDEETGALYEVPCSIGYLIKENRDYATAGSAVVVPSGMVDCYFQINSKTNKIKPNQRFLFGNPSNWTAYRVEGGGINNFNNQETFDNNSAALGRFSLAVDFVNKQTDDLVNGIANAYDNQYVVTLDQSSISGNATQTIQLRASVTLNGESVVRTLIWSSNNTSIATVNSSGLVTLVSAGSCIITCSLSNNSSVYDTTSVTVGVSPVDNYQVVVSPDKNYILEGQEQTWLIYLYKNNVQQADTFSFSLDSNTVPSSNYIYTVLGDNSFKIKNIKMFLTDNLEITATSGLYSKTIIVSLNGAW
jgi:hypothetical protein